MQREREGRDDSIHSGRPFDSFGAHRNMISSIFGGRDPFDDPFFTRPFGNPFGNAFGSSGPFGDSQRISSSKGPIIEELNTDDEGEVEGGANDTGDGSMKDKAQKNPPSSKGPLVEHPDDQTNGEKVKDLHHRSGYNRVEGTQPQSKGVSFRKVTYGGINGAYYTATTSQRMGSDGVVLEETKQADRTTGQAAHRISKGIHDKGHTVMRKLDSDGKVDTMQTLHNLNEDELTGFEQAWKRNFERHLPVWNEGFTSYDNAGASSSRQSTQAASRGRPKKVVTINIE